eukprot:14159732-Alexandrium_andersonii.AAC.1
MPLIADAHRGPDTGEHPAWESWFLPWNTDACSSEMWFSRRNTGPSSSEADAVPIGSAPRNTDACSSDAPC